jgi:hypothetical protein
VPTPKRNYEAGPAAAHSSSDCSRWYAFKRSGLFCCRSRSMPLKAHFRSWRCVRGGRGGRANSVLLRSEANRGGCCEARSVRIRMGATQSP